MVMDKKKKHTKLDMEKMQESHEKGSFIILRKLHGILLEFSNLPAWLKEDLSTCLSHEVVWDIMHRTEVSGNLDISVYAHTGCSENIQSILHVKSFMFNKPEVGIRGI